jgi:alpha-tubulin suppressor-like RCC1 family protein
VQRADFLITGAVAAGQQHILALAGEATMWTWGRGSERQIGDRLFEYRESPNADLTDAISLKGGEYFSIAGRADGSVWGWGA